MRASAEPSSSETGPERPLGPRWRARSESEQQAALPSGRVVVSCSAPLGVGGLGRHQQEILRALERAGQPGVALEASGAGEGGHGALRGPRLTTILAPAMRLSPAWRHWRTSVAFDRDAARRLAHAEHLIGFNGTSVAQFRAARQMGFQSVSLMSANSHMRRVIRQHAKAYRDYPLERPWATRLLKRNLLEYEQADRIYLASRYGVESFLEEGFSEEALSLFPLIPDARFAPAAEPRPSSTFDVLYVGSLTVNKGVALLIDAFARLGHADMRLVLVGGWKTRGMGRFVREARARDPRIVVSPGDPLPHLRAARLCVHPAYEDGFAYAPAEALACGVPVLVSEDTGMKDLVRPGVDGVLLPTGDRGALSEAIDAAYRGRLLSGQPAG
jgi:glycosyltransferase involved in cell wall biosynthesis